MSTPTTDPRVSRAHGWHACAFCVALQRLAVRWRDLGLIEAAERLSAEHLAANGKRSLALLGKRIRKHLKPIFAGRRLSSITTGDLREYAAHRQEQGAANATINRELAILRRAFVLAMHDGQLFTRPHFPTLK